MTDIILKEAVVEQPGWELLKPQEKNFLMYYLDPESESYGKRGPSYFRAYPDCSKRSCYQAAYVLMKREKIMKILRAMMDIAGIGLTDRVRLIADIAHGRTEQEVIYKKMVGKGENKKEVVTGKKVIKPSAKDRLTAIHIANQVDGIYRFTDLETIKASKEIDSWAKICEETMRNVTPPPSQISLEAEVRVEEGAVPEDKSTSTLMKPPSETSEAADSTDKSEE